MEIRHNSYGFVKRCNVRHNIKQAETFVWGNVSSVDVVTHIWERNFTNFAALVVAASHTLRLVRW